MPLAIDADLASVAVAKVDLDNSAFRCRFELAPLAASVRVSVAQAELSEGHSQARCRAAV